MTRPTSPDDARRLLMRLYLAWLVFCVYGSLVPLQFHAVPPELAWQRFSEAPLLQLGVGSRADWIANGLLYLPLGLLGALLYSRRNAGPGLGAVLGAWLVAMLVALLVEFLQVYFPPRTVSLNDLVAEAIGAALGALLAWLGAGAGHRLLHRLRAADADRWPALGALYLAAIVLLALFPFDLLISQAEWAAKLAGGNVGLWLAHADLDRPSVVLAGKFLVEALAAVPVGLWLAHRRGRLSVPQALTWGAAFGLSIELLQLALASGVSQGISVATRALGVALGAIALPMLQHRPMQFWQARARSALPWLVVAHLPLLGLVYGWSDMAQASIGDARARWHDLQWLPFYYHYFTTETVAVRSLLVAVLAYAPFGFYGWARQAQPGLSSAWALAAAACIEAGRLVLPGTHPDPSNLWIAAAAAFLVHHLLLALQRPEPQPNGAHARAHDRPADGAAGARQGLRHPAQIRPAPELRPGQRRPPVPAWRWLVLAAVLALIGAHLLHFPVHALALGLGVAGAAALVVWQPVLLFVLVPAALPVLDLAPFSGRRFLDEFDLWIAACAAGAWVRLQPRGVRQSAAGLVAWSLRAVLLVLAIGTARALWPWPGLPVDAFDQPMSAFNALRVAKGGLWAGVLWWLGRRLQADGADVGRAFGWGMCAGLAATVMFVLAERMAFTYLLDFSSDYRISGPFSDMSLGGAYVECFVACALPFVLQRVLPPAPWRQVLPMLLLVAGASYTLMVTYSRGGQGAGAVAVLLFVAMQVVGRQARWHRLALGLLTLGIAAVAALPVLQGTFAQQRLATLGADIEIRERHWAESLALVGPGAMDSWLGMGLGRYAELRLWNSPPDQRAATHRLIDMPGGARAVRLSTGYAYFVEQAVSVRPQEALELRLRVRADPLGQATAADKPPRLQASVCQKWIIASFDCSAITASFKPDGGGWWSMTASLHAPPAGPGRLPRPVRLSLNNADRVTLEVAAVSLRDSTSRDLVSNGDFAAGFDRWTFTSDDHLAWHAKSLLVGTYVELGLLGVAAFLALLVTAAGRAATLAARGWTDAAPVLAALTAFSIIGLIDTLVDVPRFLLLFLLLCALPALWPPAGQHQGEPKVTP